MPATLQTARAWILTAAAVAGSGCGFSSSGTGGGPVADDTAAPRDSEPSSDDAADASLPDDAADDVDDAVTDAELDSLDDIAPDTDAGCTPKTGDICTTIVKLPGAQTVDGLGDDFACVPETVFDVHTGELTDPAPTPGYVTAIARARVAWSVVGLHLHFAVSDDTYHPTPSARPHWQGDSLELFVAGHAVLTGAYDGTIDRGAMQIVFVPPTPTATARAGIYLKGATTEELPSSLWAARMVAGGYEIEVGLPWGYIGGIGPFSSGKKIGIDLAINDVVDDARSEHFYSVLHIQKPIAAGSCGQPFCDDRVWCRSTLKDK